MGQIEFGPFHMDLEAGRLLRDGWALPLRPQAFQVLRTLFESRGKHVDYEKMIHHAWEGVSVSRHTVAVTVGEAKRALREYGCWLQYHPKLGYMLENPPANTLIRKGWHFAHLNTREGLDKGLECFRQATALDSADFQPFEGMAHCYLTLGSYGLRPPRQMHAGFEQAHAEAVRREDLTPALRGARGHALHIFERDRGRAETELLQAIGDAPHLAPLRVRLVVLYASAQRFAEAQKTLEEAYAADPLWPMLAAMEVLLLLCRRQYDCAVVCGSKAVDLHPYLPMARFFYAYALQLAGDPRAAIEQYKIAQVMSPDFHCQRAHEAICWAHLKKWEQAARILDELEDLRRKDYVDAYNLVAPNYALGRVEQALDELDRALEENSAPLFILDVDPKMDPLRGKTRFERVRNRVFGRSAHA